MKESYKTLPFILLAIIMLMCHNSVDVSSTQNSFLDNSSPLIRYEGRILETDSSMRMDYPGTRFAIGVEGAGKVYASLKPNAGYYILFVDGKLRARINTHEAPKESRLSSLRRFSHVDTSKTLREGADSYFLDSLEEGRHEIELMLISEGIFCQPAFYGFECEGKISWFALDRRPRRLEFIGNSITCGYGVDAANENCTFEDSTSNFAKSYAFLTAQAFNAEMMVVARSGIGVYRNYDDKPEGSVRPMPVVYRNVLISEAETRWDFASYQPDLLIVNLGTNDLSTPGFRMELVDSAYRNFLDEVREHYPDTKILLLTGCMLHPTPVLDEFKARLDTIVAERKRKGDERLFRLDFEPQDGSLGYAADWHPSQRQQQNMADTLIPFVSSIMGW
ncbi:MAG: hypothetical protein J6Y37_05240 [Paludibacteraceae bacterium]|nr:hypothetical protein [Paludibacteraceae bacterium]